MACGGNDSEEDFSFSDEDDETPFENQEEKENTKFQGGINLQHFPSDSDNSSLRASNIGTKKRCDIKGPELTQFNEFLKKTEKFVDNELSAAQYVSLLSDYVESEFFLIDGDSLLITCLNDKTLKKGQDLYLFYLIERFLLDLTEKGANYELIFFQDAKHLYFNYPDLLSLRTALIIHLDINTDINIHIRFSNFLSEKWLHFLKKRHPYFLIVSNEGINLHHTHFLKLFIVHALANKINVVFTEGQESDAVKMYGFHIQSKYEHQHFVKKHKKSMISFCKELSEYAQNSNNTALCSLSENLNVKKMEEQIQKTIAQLKDLWPEGSDVRHILCAVTCSVGLKMYNDVLEEEQDNSNALSLEDAADLCRMHCLSVVLRLLLPLSQRAQTRIINSQWNKQASTFIQFLKRCECIILDNVKQMPCRKVKLTYLSDLSDNLLWMNIAYCYEKEDCTGLKFGKEIEEEYQRLWNIVLHLVGNCEIGQSFPLRETTKPLLNVNQIPFQEPKKIPNIGLIKVQSDLVDDYAADVLKTLPFLHSNDPAILSLVKRKSFDELKHWHSRKLITQDNIRCNFYGEPKDPRMLTKYQKLKAYYQFYGKHLEGNISTTITYQNDKSKDKPTADKNSKAPHEYSFASKTIWDMFAEQNKKKLKAKEGESEHQQWKTIAEDITKNITSGISKLDSFLKTCQSNSTKLMAEMMGLDACFGVWIEHCRKQGEQSRDLTIVAQLMRRIHNILGKYEELLQSGERQVIAKYLKYLGFKNLACCLDPTQIQGDDSKKFAKFTVGMGAARFQLTYMSHYLLREERHDPDPRIKHFIPDTWQRELLDAVDNNESAVIVAPTSSGKTYASYYCMEKVLKDSNEGVLVYVAPTKALVNQVVATVYNRFTKALPEGLVVCGTFTRDYRTDTLNCQILVTVPQCLEILLLSPHQQKWAHRIKYVIFDEVHCLGGEIGAEVWEHLLVMIRCPFLALSATISNPEHLTEWLQSVKEYWQHIDSTIENTSNKVSEQDAKNCKGLKEKKKSYKVRLVLYDKRYNDLEKFVCSIKEDTFSIEKYHPCAALSVNHIKKYGIPSDLTFSPQESVQLYDIMVKSWNKWPRLRELDPEEFESFEDKVVITKNDATKYQEELKKELKNWTEKKKNTKVKKVLKLLQPSYVYSSEKEKQEQFPLFVDKLREMDKLPALFFLFNIKIVEKLAENVCTYLEKKQEINQIKLSLREEKKLVNKGKTVEDSTECEQSGSTNISMEKMTTDAGFCVQKKKKRQQQESKRKELDATKDSPGKTHDTMQNKAKNEALLGEVEKIAKLFPDCTYADSRTLNEETLEKVFERAEVVRKRDVLKSLAMRGIGYHHASLEPEGRQVVEMLFRMGFVKVVTATGSLALGINMPCKSVVFTQDSVYLDALNYRQMSGRAGRRGQDMTGSVFFYDVPLPKVEKLIKANVPELKGQFPLSITLVLRLMLLMAKADDKEDAKAKVLSVLKHSLLSFKKPKYMDMLKLYFLFSLQFLVQEEYLDKEGNPMGLTGLVSHLHYHEPANFVLVSFLLKGLFHKLLHSRQKGQDIFSKAQMEKIVLVLANIFGRRCLPSSILQQKKSFQESEVILEKLPEDFAAAVNEYNSKIEEVFGCFLLTVSKIADMEEEYCLPLSKLKFAGTKKFDDSELVTHLMSCKEKRSSVSPFACLSGNMDHDLFHANNVKSIMLRTIGIDVSNIPVLWLENLDCRGKERILNAYALDFFKHGSLKAIAAENKIHEGEAFYMLKDFFLLIKTVSISMMELCENRRDNVVLAFKQLSRDYQAKLEATQAEYGNTDCTELKCRDTGPSTSQATGSSSRKYAGPTVAERVCTAKGEEESFQNEESRTHDTPHGRNGAV